MSGRRSRGFGMGGGHEAYDAELAALAYGLIHLHGRGDTGQAYTVFTDSTAAMRRVVNDAPGPGREMAIHIIELARRIIDQGNSISIRWTPAHRGVEGNERANQAARDAASLPPSEPRGGTSVWHFSGEGPPSGPPRRGERTLEDEVLAEGPSDCPRLGQDQAYAPSYEGPQRVWRPGSSSY